MPAPHHPSPHTPNEYDTIVLGAGTMGAAACYALLNTDATTPPTRVLALDRFAPPHNQGSHHGDVRMFRMSYYEHPAYVPWLRRSLHAWKQMGCSYGKPLINMTGALYLGRPDSELIAGCLRAIHEHNLPHEQLTHAQVRARYPMFELPRDYVGLFERDAGFIWCERAIKAMLDLAGASLNHPPRAGSSLTLKTNEPALSWSATKSSTNPTVEVTTATHTYRANNLIITAGPWAASLLADLNINLTVTRQIQGWLTLTNSIDAFTPQNFPCWAIDPGDQSNPSLFYGFPALNTQGPHELKLARHSKGTPTTPDTITRTPLPTDPEDFLPLVRQFLPSLATAPVRTSTCLYTNSPDSHYLIDRHPHHPNVAIATGFTGHGFKAAPAVGQLLRTLVTMPAPHPEPFFSLGRVRL